MNMNDKLTIPFANDLIKLIEVNTVDRFKTNVAEIEKEIALILRRTSASANREYKWSYWTKKRKMMERLAQQLNQSVENFQRKVLKYMKKNIIREMMHIILNGGFTYSDDKQINDWYNGSLYTDPQ